MRPNELVTARGSYGYVPACLIESPDKEPDLIWGDLRLVRQLPSYADWNNPELRLRYASVDLDAHHAKLLNEDTEKDLLHGLASAMFWGYASGTDGRFHIERAIAKTKQLIEGHGRAAAQRPCEIVQSLRAARARLQAGDINGALLIAMGIKFLGMSFASKVLMFVDPSTAVVYDSVIGERLAHSSDARLRAMAVSTNRAANRNRQVQAYSQWCTYCFETAAAMNQNNQHKWKDWNGAEREWRAVDVERGFFALNE